MDGKKAPKKLDRSYIDRNSKVGMDMNSDRMYDEESFNNFGCLSGRNRTMDTVGPGNNP